MSTEKQRAKQINAVVRALSNATPGALSRSINDFSWPPRVSGFLRRQGIATIGDIILKTEKELLLAKSGGPDTLEEIQKVLSREGLSLGTSQSRLNELAAQEGTLSTIPVNDFFYDRNLGLGAVINFPNGKLAQDFVGMVKAILADDAADVTFDITRHMKRLPLKTAETSKVYPIFISDRTLNKLNESANLQKIPPIWQNGAAASRSFP